MINTTNNVKETNSISFFPTFSEHVFLAPHRLFEILKILKDYSKMNSQADKNQHYRNEFINKHLM